MNPKISRRSLMKVGMAGGAALFLPWKLGTLPVRAAGHVPLLEPDDIPKYATPLLVPPAMPRAGKITVRGGRNVDYYELAVRQFQQQILPAGLPKTTVWG